MESLNEPFLSSLGFQVVLVSDMNSDINRISDR
jgi:hypothetical protein